MISLLPARRRGESTSGSWGRAISLFVLVQQVASQLEGCDVLDCGSANGCTLGNTTNSYIGTVSLQTSISPGGNLTWTVGAATDETSTNSSDVSYTKNFYLGFPPSTDLAAPTQFAGCALFFEGIAKSLPLNGTAAEYGPVTCGQTLTDGCVNDLLAQSAQEVQTSRSGGDGSGASTCATLQSKMQANPPASCQSIAQVSWGNIIPRELTGANASIDPLPKSNCHPSRGGADYSMALVESQTVTSEEVSGDMVPFFYSITPVLTIFYSPSGSKSDNLPEAHLSCLKVVEDSRLIQAASSGAVAMRLPVPMVLASLLAAGWLIVP